MLAGGGRFVIRYDLSGPIRVFDEPAARELAQRDVERARDFTPRQNHNLIPSDPGGARQSLR